MYRTVYTCAVGVCLPSRQASSTERVITLTSDSSFLEKSSWIMSPNEKVKVSWLKVTTSLMLYSWISLVRLQRHAKGLFSSVGCFPSTPNWIQFHPSRQVLENDHDIQLPVRTKIVLEQRSVTYKVTSFYQKTWKFIYLGTSDDQVPVYIISDKKHHVIIAVLCLPNGNLRR